MRAAGRQCCRQDTAVRAFGVRKGSGCWLGEGGHAWGKQSVINEPSQRLGLPPSGQRTSALAGEPLQVPGPGWLFQHCSLGAVFDESL